MPLDVLGFCHDRIIFSRAYGDVTAQDLLLANNRWIEILDAVPSGTVHSLVEMYGITKYPLSILEMGKSQTYLKHPRLGWVAGYGMTRTPAINQLLSILGQAFRARISVVDTREKALAYLQKIDPQLTDLASINWDTLS